MTLEVLQKEMIAAMKSGDKFRKSVLSDIIASVKKVAIDKGCRDDVSESLVDEVLIKYKKTVQEMIDTCPGERVETMAEYVRQFDIVDEFSPKLIDDEEKIRQLIVGIALRLNIQLEKKNRGLLMKSLSAELKGKADMAVVSKVASQLLQ